MNGDGRADVLSGSYWPGDLYIFRGAGGVAFEKGAPMQDREGKTLKAGAPLTDPKNPDDEGLASVPFAYDHDGDGDLDLLVGNIEGHVILIPNEGSAKEPKFDPKKQKALEAGGAELHVSGDAGPVIADWDGDGKPDLLVGSGNGAVWLFRNTGTRNAPVYAAGTVLIAAGERGSDEVPYGGAPSRPGYRTKVCVADWNGDGRPDLLVGDAWEEAAAPRKLTDEEKARLAKLKKERDQAASDWANASTKSGGEESAEAKKAEERLDELSSQIQELEPRGKTHGSVWLYLRKAVAK